MLKVGFIGWRGMVGSVLLNRLKDCGDLSKFTSHFFSTSQVGESGPLINETAYTLQDAHDLEALKTLDVIVTCQGSGYTQRVHPGLRASGWNGFWIDAASDLRMQPDSVIVLDPINAALMQRRIDAGVRDLIGGNCTVSLMLLALHGLATADLIEWINVSTYQAISGAGAAALKTFVKQCAEYGLDIDQNICFTDSILDIERRLQNFTCDNSYTTEGIGHLLAANVLPWIDSKQPDGATREEWKGGVETNKILGEHSNIKVDGLCVRVPSIRCHAQSLTVKLKSHHSIEDIQTRLAEANEWVRVVENEKEPTLSQLTPLATSGTLDIKIGRLKASKLDNTMIHAFTVGDQLLWGAAEPLRRALMMLVDQNA